VADETSETKPKLTRSTVPRAAHSWRRMLVAAWVLGLSGAALATIGYDAANDSLGAAGLVIAGMGFLAVFVIQALAGWSTLKAGRAGPATPDDAHRREEDHR
jgi:hypothetical protein